VIATPPQPVAWIGISKDRVGDRNKVRLLCAHWADSRCDENKDSWEQQSRSQK